MSELKDEDSTLQIRKYGKGRGSSYILIDEVERKIWLDTRAFPDSTFLCAMADGCSLCQLKHERKLLTFFPIKWLIEEWGGPEEYLIHVRKLYENVSNEFGWNTPIDADEKS